MGAGSPDGKAHAHELPLKQAFVLGLLQGPSELLPVSSSAHTVLAGYLAGWSYPRIDAQQRKSFEVALHTGTAAALTLFYRDHMTRALRRLSPRQLGLLGLALSPPALAGYFLDRPIEEKLSRPAPIAAGLLCGAVGMALADLRGHRDRDVQHAGALDGLLLGMAQTLALAPGVSRNGATLTVARARGFGPCAAQRLSWQVGLPVIVGAGMLRGTRLLGGRVDRRHRGAFALGAGGSFLSSWLSARLIDPVSSERSLLPYSLYRAGLAGLVIKKVLRDRSKSVTR